MITFVGTFPSDENIKDGMIQRINSIDKLFENKKRIYLEISYKKNYKKKIIKYGNVTVYRLNYFIHRKQIKKIIKESNKLYIHSIYNYAKIRMAKNILKDKRIILDFHGVVPEELKYSGMKIKAKYFEKIESEVCKLSDKIIFVTYSMKKYIKNKYKNEKFKSEIYPILPNNIIIEDVEDNVKLRKELKIENDDIVIIYSGNCQKWQNTDYMLNVISKCDKYNYKFIILTGEEEVMTKKVRELGLINKIIIKSVLPAELKKYYSIANYGFILRDDHILNRVACPTKLIEYMQYGIIPIVKCDKIGDFYEYEYEYVKVEDLNLGLKNIKSTKNINIIKNIKSNIENVEVF